MMQTKASKKIAIGGHTFFVMLLVALFGTLSSRTLALLGMKSMMVRGSISLIASYLFFLALVNLWLRHLQKNPFTLRDIVQNSSLAESSIRKNPFSEVSWLDALSQFSGEFTLGGLLLAATIGGFVWIGLVGPSLLIDTAFDFALSVGLLRASKTITFSKLQANLFRRTISIFLFIFVLNGTILWVAQNRCPGRNLFSEVVLQCWIKQTHE